MTWFSDIVEGKRKFLSKVNHRFGLKPGVSMETMATILLQKKALLPQGYLAAAPLILHIKGKRLASLPNKGMVRF